MEESTPSGVPPDHAPPDDQVDHTNDSPVETDRAGVEPDQAWWDEHAPLVMSRPDGDGPQPPPATEPIACWPDLSPSGPGAGEEEAGEEEPAPLVEDAEWWASDHDLPGGAPSTAPISLAGMLSYPATMYQPTPARRRSGWLTGLLAGVVGAAGALGGAWALGAFDDPPLTPTVEQQFAPMVRPNINVADEDVSEVAVAVAHKVTPSIVSVEIGDGEFGPAFAPFASGSGVVIGEGLIVTNHHVIADAPSTQVVLQDGSAYPASVVGSDVETDLAVLEVPVSGLVPVDFGTTTDLTIGETAIAIGNPLGLAGGASLTVGVVSAFGRQIDTDIDFSLYGMLQTDAPITEGSSGGALVDSAGRLIGITTAIGVSRAGAEGIGFAIPVELVRRITSEIIEIGEVRHAYLGVQLRNEVTVRADGGLVPAGALIFAFPLDGLSAARDAGMEQGDVIVSLNGQPVTTREALISDLRLLHAGDLVAIEVDRDGTIVEFELVLDQRPRDL